MTDILTDRSDCHSLERLLRRRRSSFFPHSLHFLPDVRPDEFGDVLRQNGKNQLLLFFLLLVFQFVFRFDAPEPVKKRPTRLSLSSRRKSSHRWGIWWKRRLCSPTRRTSRRPRARSSRIWGSGRVIGKRRPTGEQLLLLRQVGQRNIWKLWAGNCHGQDCVKSGRYVKYRAC